MEENQNKEIKGIRIDFVNAAMLTISCVMFFMVLINTIQISHCYNELNAATNNYIVSEEAAAQFNDASDYLTNQVRLYVMTSNLEYAENYFTEINESRRREQAIQRLLELNTNPDTLQHLQNALDYSNELAEREIYAMKLISEAQFFNPELLPEEIVATELAPEDQALSRENKIRSAENLVFSETYEKSKNKISENASYFISSITQNTYDVQQTYTQKLQEVLMLQRLLLIMLFIINLLTFLMIIILIIKPLRVYVKNIKEDHEMEITGSYEFRYLALTYNDIYELNAANQQMLRSKAEHDPLTGIMNRAGFEKLQNSLKNSTSPLALLLIDVDKFKGINDTYGHEIGDAMLKKVAHLLNSHIRSNDFAIRMGGDEFAVVMIDVTPEMKYIIKHKIDSINRQLQTPKDGLPVSSISVGVSFSEKGFSDSLYHNSDLALYQVKEKGRCGCGFYDNLSN
jgi:diguanylate cyclase (GGDEF)-like protein